MSNKIFIIFVTLLLVPCVVFGKMVNYNLDISYGTVNFTGKDVKAMTINGGIPGPIVEATIGDTLHITVTNNMDVETSIHWHGILLPNEQDGVPYLTTPPIKPHSSHTFEFPIIQTGTYWYHSHTNLQEQRGVYGSIVLHPKHEPIKAQQDYVVVLSDWTNENPQQVLANLKRDGDYYALKKDSVQSWWKVLQNGSEAIRNRLRWSWMRMPGMDLSDVGYDAFLANGEQQHSLRNIKPNETIRLRLINAAASSYFNVEYAGGAMTVIGADGMAVKPFKIKRLTIAIAETYDVLVTIPDDNAYELRATSIDGTGYSSTILGKGNLIKAPDIAKPNLLLAQHSNHDMHSMKSKSHKMNHAMHQAHKPTSSQENMADRMPTIEQLHSYEALIATSKTTLPTNAPTREVRLDLTGNMERYVWSFNKKTLSEADKILIKRGENVRFILTNRTMMSHPIHLHGHFFRVLNGQGDYSPLKHTVDVPAMGQVIIEFAASEEKDWFFHCHNLYHMKSGMARVVSYQETTRATPRIIGKLTGDKHWYRSNDLSIASNMIAGMMRVSNSRNAFEVEFDYDYDREYDIEAIYERSITRFFNLYAGVNLEREDKNEASESVYIVGLSYTLPMLIESNLRLDSDGKVRLELGSQLQLTNRTNFEWEWNTDDEYRFTLSYEINKKLSISANYDSDYEAGVGIRFKF